jgi:hypothetical protein
VCPVIRQISPRAILSHGRPLEPPRPEEAPIATGVDRAIDLEEKELEERHAYVRLNFRLFIQWFIFFMTLDWLAFAYAIQPGRQYATIVAVLFASQCSVGALAAEVTRRYLIRTGTRVDEITARFRQLVGAELQSAMPTAAYAACVQLITVCLVTNALAWLWLLTRLL